MSKTLDRRQASTEFRIGQRRTILRKSDEICVPISRTGELARLSADMRLQRLEDVGAMLVWMSCRGAEHDDVRTLLPKAGRPTQQLICDKRGQQLSLPISSWTRETIHDLSQRKFGTPLTAVHRVRGRSVYRSLTSRKTIPETYQWDESPVNARYTSESAKFCVSPNQRDPEKCRSSEIKIRSDKTRGHGGEQRNPGMTKKLSPRVKKSSIDALKPSQTRTQFEMHSRGSYTHILHEVITEFLIDYVLKNMPRFVAGLYVEDAEMGCDLPQDRVDRIRVNNFSPCLSPELNLVESINNDLACNAQQCTSTRHAPNPT